MLVQLAVSGLALGSMYGLVALGYHITWATSRTMNFSQGHVVMVGAIVAYGVHVAAGWPLAVAVLGALAASAAVGMLVSFARTGDIGPARADRLSPRATQSQAQRKEGRTR